MNESGSDTRVIFAGTPAFATPCLDGLVRTGHTPVAVFTQPDRPAGRGRKVSASPVKQRALELEIPVHQSASLRDPEALALLQDLAPDLMVVVAYGLILPSRALSIPVRGCVNVHASSLPRWRGAAPIHRAVMAGDPTTGVCLMSMTEGLDEGPVFAHAETPIETDDTTGSLQERLAEMGAELLTTHLDALLDGSLNAIPQNEEQASYARKIAIADLEIDWSRDAVSIARQVRGLAPAPIARTTISGLREVPLRIWSATATTATLDISGSSPGTVIAESRDGIQVVTGDGVLCIHRLQLPGKRAIDVKEFLNGRRLLGLRLGGSVGVRS